MSSLISTCSGQRIYPSTQRSTVWRSTSRDAFYIEINKRSNTFGQRGRTGGGETVTLFLSRGATRVVSHGYVGHGGETAGIATRQRNSSSYTADGRVFYHISRVWGEHTVWPCQLCPWSIPWPSARASAEFHEPLSPLPPYICIPGKCERCLLLWRRWRCTISSLFIGPQPRSPTIIARGAEGRKNSIIHMTIRLS